jgi:hypothetical protein
MTHVQLLASLAQFDDRQLEASRRHRIQAAVHAAPKRPRSVRLRGALTRVARISVA